MIFYELAQLYDSLVKKGELSAPEWKVEKVNYALDLSADGEILNLIKLGEDKKPIKMNVPAHKDRSASGKPFFLYDKTEYILGICTSNKPEQAKINKDTSYMLHMELLEDVDSDAAKSVLNFYKNREEKNLAEDPVIAPYLDDLTQAFFVFYHNGKPVHNDPAIIQKWEKHINEENAQGKEIFCIVSGEHDYETDSHPIIKGVTGAQASGARLVSFKEPAFWSYGKEKGENAAVSHKTALKYGAALNYLLSDFERTFRIGNLTVTAWAESGDKEYNEVFAPFIEEGGITDGELAIILDRLRKGEASDLNGITINPKSPFYILGMAPNAGRISANFFYKNTFGNWIENLSSHRERLEIQTPSFVENKNLPIWMILSELKPKGQKNNNSPLARSLLKSILNNTPYPRELLYSVLKRIKANSDEPVQKEKDAKKKPLDKAKKTGSRINWKKAAILKAYLLKNSNKSNVKEVARVSLNTETNSQPYLLGRMFSILENIQEASSGGTNSTITDTYLTRMCTNPVSVFAKLLELKSAHMKKLKRDNKAAAIALDKQLGEIMDKFTDKIPKQLNAEEQAEFMLGYYHQNQKRYEKKQKNDLEKIDATVEEELL